MAIFHLPFSIFHLFHLFRFFQCAHFPVNYAAHCCQLCRVVEQPATLSSSVVRNSREHPLSHTPTSDGNTQAAHVKFSRNSHEIRLKIIHIFLFFSFSQNENILFINKKAATQKKSREKICADIQCECGRGPPRRRQTILTANKREREKK